MGLNPGQINLCANVDKKFKDMCKGYIKYLIDCPSFVHNICHEDMGGECCIAMRSRGEQGMR